MRSLARTGLLLPIVLAAGQLSGAESSPEFASRLAPIPACEALTAAARTHQIPLQPLDPPTESAALNPGDSLAAIVTFREKGGRRTQWLLDLRVGVAEPKEQPDKTLAPTVIYTSTGNKLEFNSLPAFLNLRTLGPFADSDAKRRSSKLQDKSSRFALNQDFLVLGLDQAAKVVLRLRESKPTHTDRWFSFSGTPFRETEVKAGRKLAEAVKLTAQEERALAGSGPALMSYFRIIQRTSDLEEILLKILEKPSLWSMLRRGGISISFRTQSKLISPADPATWGLPARQPAYYIPVVLELNNQPALNITLVVTAPQPPLLACGGIVGLLAECPGERENLLTLRIVSAQHAARKR